MQRIRATHAHKLHLCCWWPVSRTCELISVTCLMEFVFEDFFKLLCTLLWLLWLALRLLEARWGTFEGNAITTSLVIRWVYGADACGTMTLSYVYQYFPDRGRCLNAVQIQLKWLLNIGVNLGHRNQAEQWLRCGSSQKMLYYCIACLCGNLVLEFDQLECVCEIYIS